MSQLSPCRAAAASQLLMLQTDDIFATLMIYFYAVPRHIRLQYIYWLFAAAAADISFSSPPLFRFAFDSCRSLFFAGEFRRYAPPLTPMPLSHFLATLRHFTPFLLRAWRHFSPAAIISRHLRRHIRCQSCFI